MTRHEQRYKAMTLLYQIFLYKNNNIDFNVDEIINNELEENNKFITDLIHGVVDNLDEIDELASKYLENWSISRLGFTDQAILRIGIYELMKTKTPDKTCIDEAIELAHEYSDEAVSKIINGVLDKVYHNEILKK